MREDEGEEDGGENGVQLCAHHFGAGVRKVVWFHLETFRDTQVTPTEQNLSAAEGRHHAVQGPPCLPSAASAT